MLALPRMRRAPSTRLGSQKHEAGAGIRRHAELTTVRSALRAPDQIMNATAAMRHISNARFGGPIEIRLAADQVRA
jgi:pyruvate/2-oxoglutarate/acetoin dehydrogenase E1 component